MEKIVGEEFFAAMARAFVTEQPPCTPLLATYGDQLAAFIAAFEPAREIAYLADVARLEAAVHAPTMRLTPHRSTSRRSILTLSAACALVYIPRPKSFVRRIRS